MLVRLRPRALGGVDHEQEQVDPVAPATIVRTKRSWPGTSTSESRRPSGQLERRVAEVDRDPALALLGQPVGVLARQRPDEPRLAVVDVARGADRQRHAGDGRGDLVDLGVGERAAVEQQPAVADDADDRRLAEAQRLRERLLDRAREARQLGERQRAAADARDRLLDRAADERGQPLGPRPHGVGGSCEHPQHGDPLGRVVR